MKAHDEEMDSESEDSEEITEKLTPYELQRQPLQLLTTGTCSIDSSSLTQGTLICAICLSILRNVKTVPKCLHRFCGECIEDALRKGRKECPTCRVEISSRRDLRSESRIDFLLGTLLGDLDEWEDEQAMQVQTLTDNLNMDALRVSVSEGIQRQSDSAAGRRKVLPSADQEDSRFVALEILPYPESEETQEEPAPFQLKRRYICAPESTFVGTLHRYVLSQLTTDHGAKGQVTLFSKNLQLDRKRRRLRESGNAEIQVIPEELTLADLATMTNHPSSLVSVYFRFIPQSSNEIM